MSDTQSVLVLAGDGIGPEVMAQVERLVDWFNHRGGAQIALEHDLCGGCAIDAHGVPLTQATLDRALEVDAVLLGAVGGPKWDGVPYAIRPEAGLLALRKELGLFANLRPAMVFDALVGASSLKPEIVRGLDILIVRELTGGVYFGQPKEMVTLEDGQRRAVDTQVYTSNEIRRIAAVAFDLARLRQGRVCSSEKSNVMISGRLWRDEVIKLHREAHGDIELSHMLADALAMQLCRWPKQFDVIVTDNLFGDMLSDEAAMLTGSLGMLPSASLGAEDEAGRRKALYEPVHGSAPDIAGEDKANPIATILSFAMMLRYSFKRLDDAALVEGAVQTVLDRGYRTGDILDRDRPEGQTAVGTKGMGDAILEALEAAVA